VHYHVRVPDAGDPSIGIAGGAAPGVIEVVLLRARSVAVGAAAAGAALAGIAGGPGEAFDPLGAGSCADPGDRPPWANLRSPPPVRVVRVPLDAADLPRAVKVLRGTAGLRAAGGASLGAGTPGRAWLDAHVVQEEK
jgi:hypothetical protein